MVLTDDLYSLNQRLKNLEERLSEIGYDTKRIVQSEIKRKWKIPAQATTAFGMQLALCVETIDPWKQNRVRYFNPLFHTPKTPLKSLPFAFPISPMGGFDDCGLTWVPPAGSTVCLVYENGHRDSAFYIGTTWHRDRGPDGNHKFALPIEEYEKIHEGHRKGYLVGPNDGSQVFPPWNTENANGFDIDSISDFDSNPEAQRKTTYAHIYGMKTPQKHMEKWVDGDYKCNHRYKRMEWKSSLGNWMIFKDDYLHPCGQWAHPKCCSSGGGSEIDCTDSDGNPIEKPDCKSKNLMQGECSNPYFKQESECRPYKGPGTPQNNKCDLPQAGIQLLSYGGCSFVMDDSVEEPEGIPNWEKGLEPFGFGCTDKFTGKTYWVSVTGHRIEMSDKEEDTNLRGEENYIRIISASGNSIELNDHTVGECVAGEKRGIKIVSTSNHSIELIDEGNKQCSPERKEGGEPTADADKALIRIRSGYGIEIEINDSTSQKETKDQFLRIFCPQKDNTDRGPHEMIFQEKAEGPGQIFVRAGGDYICSTYDAHITLVGDPEKENSAYKYTYVSSDTYIDTKEFYFNTAKNHAFLAEEKILLLAGKDVPPTEGGECGPTTFPVLCLTDRGITISDRVFVSASPDAGCASILHLVPFHECQKPEGCST